MNEAHFIFFLLYVADMHNLKIEKKLRVMCRPKVLGSEKANLARQEALAGVEVGLNWFPDMKSFFLQIKVVTKETPGYLPILSATSHSVAAPPSSEGAGDIKL